MHARTWGRVGPAVALAVVLLLRPSAPAAQASQERVLYVSALDAAGAPVEGLGPDAFVVRENNSTREILRVGPATDPIDLTILIDNSTAASDEVTYFRRALPEFITKLVPPHTVSLVGLAQRPTVLVPSTTDAKRLVSRAESLFAVPQSGATLLDAIVEVSEGLMKREAPRAAIVAIFTDGQEFTNRYAKDVIAAARKAQTAVHLVSIGQFVENVDHEFRERNFVIAQAPRATGGSHTSMLVANGLAPHLEKVARELNSQYKVVYARPDSLIPPDTIDVTAARPGLTVRGTPARPGKGV